MAVLDFGDAEPQRRFDDPSILEALAATAETWVPRYFPHGRRDGDTWRCANMRGDAPRKAGSFVIQLNGGNAGQWFDHDPAINSGGGPLALLRAATGLEGAELWGMVAEIGKGDKLSPATRGNTTRGRHTRVKATVQDAEAEIKHILAHAASPTPDSRLGIYLKSRGLDIPDCEDLLFHGNLTDWQEKVGRPAMVAIVRDWEGNQIGLHRTYLAYDGLGKAEMESNPRKMLGTVRGGAVRLYPIGEDGVLGLAEGLETAMAVYKLFQIPTWAALSAGGIVDFQLPAGIKKLIVFADRGDAGETAARKVQEAIGQVIPVKIVLPKGDDDFNDDALKGFWEGIENEMPQGPFVSGGESVSLSVTQGILDSSVPNVQEASQRPISKLAEEITKVEPIWSSQMIRNKHREPKVLLENVSLALERAPEWQGVIGTDIFAQSIIMRRPAPWIGTNGHFQARPWRDSDDLETTRWLQRAGLHVPTIVVHDGICAVAATNEFHPVREYLNNLIWDKTPRLDIWCSYYLGASDTAFARAVGSRWLMSAIARIMQPGCKSDSMLILESPRQGIGKSTVPHILFFPWFSDELPDIGSKDAAIQLLGKWCIEFSDLEGFTKADKRRLKAFLSRTIDRYRPPYGRHAIDQPRSCVFAGTCNEEQYLDDDSGGRRFWPIRCLSIDLEALERDRDQLWAEAVERYAQGERYFLHEDEILGEAEAEQEARQQGDAIHNIVEQHLNSIVLSSVTLDEVLTGISIPRERWDKGMQMRVGHALKRCGWARYREMTQGTRSWKYRRP